MESTNRNYNTNTTKYNELSKKNSYRGAKNVTNTNNNLKYLKKHNKKEKGAFKDNLSPAQTVSTINHNENYKAISGSAKGNFGSKTNRVGDLSNGKTFGGGVSLNHKNTVAQLTDQKSLKNASNSKTSKIGKNETVDQKTSKNQQNLSNNNTSNCNQFEFEEERKAYSHERKLVNIEKESSFEIMRIIPKVMLDLNTRKSSEGT